MIRAKNATHKRAKPSVGITAEGYCIVPHTFCGCKRKEMNYIVLDFEWNQSQT